MDLVMPYYFIKVYRYILGLLPLKYLGNDSNKIKRIAEEVFGA